MQSGRVGYLKISAIMLFAIMAMMTATDTMAQKEIVRSYQNETVHPDTGWIDRIGAKVIVINDTLFNITDNISLSGFKKGDFVSFSANSNYDLIKLQHGKTESETNN